MFQPMRRYQQALPPEECATILKRATAGVLAVSGNEGYPYAVPLNFVFDDSRPGCASIYFHSAKTGHKLDAIARNDKVSFCVVDRDDVVPREYTTYFRSVIVFGRARILENEAQKRAAIEKLALKYSPDDEEGRIQEINRSFPALCMVEIRIEHITGKEAVELHRKRQECR